MILKSERLADLLIEGNKISSTDPFVITPTPDLIEMRASGAASLDLRLGTWFVTLRQARMSHLQIESSISPEQFTKTHYVRFGKEYYLHPGKFVLAGTIEWIRLPRNIAAYVIGRSSWGRRGLVIATAAGVHPGFKGCLTLELKNLGEIPIAIKPGMMICQLFFHKVDTSESQEIDRSRFVGLRKPILGKIKEDKYSEDLGESQGGLPPGIKREPTP